MANEYILLLLARALHLLVLMLPSASIVIISLHELFLYFVISFNMVYIYIYIFGVVHNLLYFLIMCTHLYFLPHAIYHVGQLLECPWMNEAKLYPTIELANLEVTHSMNSCFFPPIDQQQLLNTCPLLVHWFCLVDNNILL